MNRRLSWDNQAGMDDSKAALKKAMSDVIQSSSVGSPDGATVANVKDEGYANPDPFSGLRLGRSVEDAEKDAIDNLFRLSKTRTPTAKTPLRNIKKYLKTQRAPRDVTPGEVLRATAAVAEPEATVIDPITNRRVPHNTSFTPKTEDVDVHTNPARQTEPDDFPDDAHKYGPIQWNEPDGLPKLGSEEQSNKYDDLAKYRTVEQAMDGAAEKPNYDDLGNYKPMRWNEPDGLQKPVAGEDSKEYKDLDKYKPTQYDDPNTPKSLTQEEESKNYKDLENYRAVSWNEPNGLQKATPEELSKNYDDLQEYGAVRWNEPDGLEKQTAEELSKNYSDLGKYEAVRWNEPDGLQKPTPEERTKNYNDLDKYGPVQWNEPDGLEKETPEEASKHYKDLSEYKSVMWNEPDGLRKLTPEELSKNYDDLRAYNGPRVVSNSVLKAYVKSQLNTTPKGQVLAAKVEVLAEDPGKEYKDLSEYGPIRWNEPDGLQKPTPEELSKQYNDLHLYDAVRWNEPNGLIALTPEEKSKAYKDVHLYSAEGATGSEDVPNRVHPEEASKAYTDLHTYGPVRWNEPDGLRKTTLEEESKAYTDLPAYAASKEASMRRHPEEVSKEYKDLDQYEPQSFDSPSEPYAATDAVNGAASFDGAVKQYDDFARYDPQQFDSASTLFPNNPEEATKDYPILDSHDGAAQPKPDGSSGKVYTSSRGPGPSRGYSHYGISDMDSENTNRLDHPEARGIRADVQKEKEIKTKLEEAKVEHEKSWDLATEDVQDHLKHTKSSYAHQFTGNYVRDFPEDFSASWSTENSSSKRTLLPDNQASTEDSTTLISPLPCMEDTSAQDAEVSSMDESFPGTKLESALDRQLEGRSANNYTLRRRKIEADPYSTAPQGLQTSYEKECAGSPTWPTMVRHYGAVSEKPSEDGVSSAGPAKLYKILAYDWKTDAVLVAETWSSVVDNTTAPLTPAEIITRLSNPSRFFPYFAPLESQGYEMVSGTGDVLVFRKVREPSAYPLSDPPSTSSAATTNGETTDATILKPPVVNPIDMMGKSPITGNFASPTGFVNYDNVTERADKPAPPFIQEVEAETIQSRSAVAATTRHRPRHAAGYRGRGQDNAPPKERGKFKFMVKMTAASVVSLYGIGMVLNWIEKNPSLS